MFESVWQPEQPPLKKMPAPPTWYPPTVFDSWPHLTGVKEAVMEIVDDNVDECFFSIDQLTDDACLDIIAYLPDGSCYGLYHFFKSRDFASEDKTVVPKLATIETVTETEETIVIKKDDLTEETLRIVHRSATKVVPVITEGRYKADVFAHLRNHEIVAPIQLKDGVYPHMLTGAVGVMPQLYNSTVYPADRVPENSEVWVYPYVQGDELETYIVVFGTGRAFVHAIRLSLIDGRMIKYLADGVQWVSTSPISLQAINLMVAKSV